MYTIAILTISDKGFIGTRADETGPVLKSMLIENGFHVDNIKILPDEIDQIQAELIYLCDSKKTHLIITNGGTGFSPRDITPEATLNVIERQTPGFCEVMRQKSMEITPKAMLSRAVSGIRGSTLIINLPGSPKGAKENLGFILPALYHGLDILNKNASECAVK